MNSCTNPKFKRTSSFLLFIIQYSLLLLLSSCSSCRKNNEPSAPSTLNPQTSNLPTASFNSDSAYDFVKAQCDFGPRVPNTKAHDACADYLTGALKAYTPNVLVQHGQ